MDPDNDPADLRAVAVLMHWLYDRIDDAPLRTKLGRSQHGSPLLNGEVLFYIAATYSLLGLYVRKQPASVRVATVEQYIDLIHDLSERWPQSLTDRARCCINLAIEAKARSITNGLHLSAATKLMWFLKPSRWTMFDSKARLGVGLSGAANVENCQQFYEILAGANFDSAALEIGNALTREGFHCLWGERVLDKYLMLRSRGLKMQAEIGKVQAAAGAHYGDMVIRARAVADTPAFVAFEKALPPVP